jgi:hypothetical protein
MEFECLNKNIHLGDVVVSNQIVDYDLGQPRSLGLPNRFQTTPHPQALLRLPLLCLALLL